ncbi:bacterial nucleoid protein Hbs [Lachnospiraceae bacterium KHCPX20]|nr:bacterial nucleoid protein Hbs [Lachnospiraceae bacterium KHCPX20]
MNKTELIASMAEKTGLSKNDLNQAVKAFCDTITEAMKANDSVNLVGFGSFTVAERKERKGRNPSTGEEITIPASKTVKFKTGKALRAEIK